MSESLTKPNTTAVVLTIGFADPTGAGGIQADLLTFASMGSHGLSVMSGLTISDSTGYDAFQAIDSDWVDDQARAVLEDMPCTAIKISEAGSLENIAVIAEIASDYPDLPFIFAPSLALHNCLEEQDNFGYPELLEAEVGLLLSQSSLYIAHIELAMRHAFSDTSDVDGSDTKQIADSLLARGCEYVLLLGTTDLRKPFCSSLYAQEGLVRQDIWETPPYSLMGAEDTLAAAISTLLATGLEVPVAVAEAHEFLKSSLQQPLRLGMGHTLPDRFFWIRSEEDQ
ncbi:bifunctional hydroxymethylpyrimidine kinase/phosphomethylpyrimidine kinase [Ampullimonas aquatilis]|uniref:bifunctional hydroxymethylpyrimidine kinase/phosphomethylpyrimidine kinase n=1 Tax=Ampullimonas aquatilis TaxID=1341549 RepID=UPI003C71274D